MGSQQTRHAAAGWVVHPLWNRLEGGQEFTETDGELPTSIEWIANRNLPRGTFPDQSAATAASSCNCRY
jgi:hypothetical protein